MRPLRITKITTPTDNFRDWVQFYSHVLRPYYQDFIKLFDNNQSPSFEDFLEYCYNNTRCYFNHRKRKYECRIYRDY